MKFKSLNKTAVKLDNYTKPLTTEWLAVHEVPLDCHLEADSSQRNLGKHWKRFLAVEKALLTLFLGARAEPELRLSGD